MKRVIIPLTIFSLCPVAAPSALAVPAPTARTEASLDECMVIGGESDPVKGTKLYMDAISAWRQGLRQKALDAYEEALLADRGVLAKPDEGLAFGLLERYRERVSTATPSAALLCRQGFFENVISGNLEASIAEYRKAAVMAVATTTRSTAGREADRLQKELEYIRNWQMEYRRKVALQRKRDDAEIAFLGRVDSVDERLEALQDERVELEERLSYLRDQERDGRETLMTSIQRASRYRRTYYYPGRQYSPITSPTTSPAPSPTTYTGPAVGPIPSPPPGAPRPLASPPPGAPDPLTTEQINAPAPLSSPPPGAPGPLTDDQINPPGGLPTTQLSPSSSGGEYQLPPDGSTLSLFYRNRHEAQANESALNSIRAEIAGIERRIEEVDKLIEKVEKERDLLFNPPAASTSAPIQIRQAPSPMGIRE